MTKDDNIRVHALKMVQPGAELFTFVMSSRELHEIAYVGVRQRGGQADAYQRILSKKRCQDIGQFIQRPGALLPNNLIVALPAKARFEAAADSDRSGTLIIPRKPQSAWIVDGQHRLFGFKYAEGKDFPLIVTAFISKPVAFQAEVFRTINREQKGVNPSLVYDLLDLVKTNDFYDQRGHEIVKALNEEEDSPWLEQIKMIGTGPGLISQAAFMKRVKQLLKDVIYQEYEGPDQVLILKNFFNALKLLYPEAWGSKKHVLTKTLGFNAVMLSLPKILILCGLHGESFEEQTMRDIMSAWPENISFSSDALGGYGGEKGAQQIAEVLKGQLPKIRPASDDLGA